MSKKLVFDTLKYAQFLTEGGVEHADVHSAGLANAITQNFYIKYEVEKMFDATIKQFEGRSHQMKDEFNERSHQMREEFKESLKKFDERTYQVIDEMRKDSHRIELEIKEIGNQTVNRLTRNIAIMIAIFTLIEILLHTKILG